MRVLAQRFQAAFFLLPKMHYLATVMVERSDRLPPEQREGGHHFLAAGGLPSGQVSFGPWSDGQRAAVQVAIDRYLAQTAAREVESGYSPLESVFRSEDNWVATFSFDTGGAGSLETVRWCAELLYECLMDATADHGLTVTLYESI